MSAEITSRTLSSLALIDAHLLRMPHFSGVRFAAMECDNAIGLFR